MKLILLIALASIIALADCFAADQSICNPGTEISYFPNGAVRSCLLRDFYPIDGITCNHLERITFHGNGKLQSCVSSDEVLVGNVPCADTAG